MSDTVIMLPKTANRAEAYNLIDEYENNNEMLERIIKIFFIAMKKRYYGTNLYALYYYISQNTGFKSAPNAYDMYCSYVDSPNLDKWNLLTKKEKSAWRSEAKKFKKILPKSLTKPNEYNLFFKKRYQEIKQVNKQESFINVSRMIADEWRYKKQAQNEIQENTI